MSLEHRISALNSLSFFLRLYRDIMAAKELKKLSFEEVAKVRAIDAAVSNCRRNAQGTLRYAVA
jgi:hypothetical protein